jgi:iron complex outermembrane receptor protein
MHHDASAGEQSDAGLLRPSHSPHPHDATHGCLSRWLVTLPGLAALITSSVCAASPLDLSGLSLEELADIRITSVSKKEERLADAAASIFVITNEDLRRSGVTNLPEALRLAPNLHVAEVSAYGYTISARGFNSSSANKLLVLIDGRSVYTPLFSGVFWDVQDVMLEDVERIEVISGPGGTLWGTNAVNGVINIITRSSKNTHGGLAAIGGGNRRNDSAFRYGGVSGSEVNYRIYGMYTDRDHTATASEHPINDASHKTQLGFRTDWSRTGDQFTVQGNLYRGTEQQPEPGMISISGVRFALGPIALSGADLIARWERLLEAGSHLNLQVYYDRTDRTVPPTFSESLDIVDAELQHTLPPTGKHALTWGASYRYSRDRVVNSQYVAFLPANLNQKWTSVFAQDEVTLRDDLHLTLGARIERNDYTGNEFLPSARLAWKLAPAHSLWSAVSRTVRAPSRLDHDTFVPGTAPFLLNGGSTVRSELANVFEIGYRGQSTSRLSYSATAFHTVYDYLRTQEIAASRTYVFYANQMEGFTNGFEMWGACQVSARWRLSGGLTALKENLTLKPGSNDQTAVIGKGLDPAYAWLLRSSFDLSSQSELDVTARHVAALSNPTVPAYTVADLRYSWRPHQSLELSVTAQNLIGNAHAEFSSPATRSEFSRTVFFKVLARF